MKIRLVPEQEREDFESFRVYAAGRYRGMLTQSVAPKRRPRARSEVYKESRYQRRTRNV